MNSPEICAVLRCSRPAYITYRSKPISLEHWQEHCHGKKGFSLKDITAYKPECRKAKV